MRKRKNARSREHDLFLADRGVGPLLARDYWGVIRDCRSTPKEIVSYLRRHFPAFAPDELVVFSRRQSASEPLSVGDELDVLIRGRGSFLVQVIHTDEQSLTLSTIEGHPEAGRITFGSYRNSRGDVVFHIRSHARSSTRVQRAGFLALGEVMQTSTWTDFVNRVAVFFGEGVLGFIYAGTRYGEEEADEYQRTAPTFLATEG